MARTISPEMLDGFLSEARGYLADIAPVIRSPQAADADAMELAYRRSHTIKGSASMLGLSSLSHVANVQEQVLEALREGQLPFSDAVANLLVRTFTGIAMCLDGVNKPEFDATPLLTDVVTASRRIFNLPEAEDAQVMSGLLPAKAAVAEAAVPAVPAAVVPPAKGKGGRKATNKKGTKNGATAEAATAPTGTASPINIVAQPDPALEFVELLRAMLGVDAEYAAIYADESDENLRDVRTQLARLEVQPDDVESLRSVRRLIHNLKGAAGTVGFKLAATLAHRIEDVLDRIGEGQVELAGGTLSLVYHAVDALEDLAGRSFEIGAMSRRLADLFPQLNAAMTAAPVVASTTTAVASPNSVPSVNVALDNSELRIGVAITVVADAASVGSDAGSIRHDDDASDAKAIERRVVDMIESLQPAFIDIDGAAPASHPLSRLMPSAAAAASEAAPETSLSSGEAVRIPIAKLDDMVKLVSELVVNRTSFEQRMTQLASVVDELKFSLGRLDDMSHKFATQYEAKTLGGKALPWANAGVDSPSLLRQATAQNADRSEFDELEMDRYTEFHILARSLAEAASDIRTVGSELTNLRGDFDSLLTRQGHISRDLQDRLLKARMVPLAALTSRLRRSVRAVAEQVGKQIDLRLEGESVQLDKSVIDRLLDPLLHLMRNAVDHGIESEADRTARGKQARATVGIRAFHQGTQVVLQVFDDGGGLNLEAIRAAAVRGEFVSATAAAALEPADLQQLIFLPGLSTATKVDEVSGRGVGMDVVKSVVHQLKGTISVESRSAEGTTFTIRLPMTLAITKALLVSSCHETFAIPLPEVLQIVRVERNQLERVGQSPVLRMGGQVYPLIQLGEALHLPAPADETSASVPVLFVATESHTVALAVDRIIAAREIVVKTLGTHLRKVHGVIGATLMGDGSVLPILNCNELIAQPAVRREVVVETTRTESASGPISVLVVDDSVSVRRVTQKLLQQAGIETILARDGVDALETLQRLPQAPDLVLLDVEMPRMDGYELLSTLRSQPEYTDLPIVMVTSRSGDKHRNKAMDLGATDYLVKPYDEDDLITRIRSLVEEARSLVGV